MRYTTAILLAFTAAALALAAPSGNIARGAPETTRTLAERLSPSAATSASAKKGIGYNDPNLTKKLAISWAYNWGQTPSGSLNSGVEYVPMLWNAAAGSTWNANAQAAIASGSKHLLAFNEPDLDSQADMTVAQSVTAWKQYMSPLVGKGAKLGSMAVTNGGAPMGIAYLQAFFAACPQCAQECDFVALHWYDAAWNTGYFTALLTVARQKNYLADAYKTLQKPIWLTEFAGSGTVAEQQAFLKYVIPWVEKQTFIERYAGFGDFVGNYVYTNGSLTPLGQTYSQTK